MLLRAKLLVVAGGIAASAALFSGTAMADTPAATASVVVPHASVIPVPSGYIYDPSLGSLHDYCTDSPDGWGSADFRGPCARHDMCYEAPGDHKSACDAELRDGITNNCVAAYPSHPDACTAAGYTYWAAVVAFGDDPAFASPSNARPATSEAHDIAQFSNRS